MSELSEEKKQLLAKMEADYEAAKKKPRVQGMRKKMEFPVGVKLEQEESDR
jgi:hypothetical protein